MKKIDGSSYKKEKQFHGHHHEFRWSPIKSGLLQATLSCTVPVPRNLVMTMPRAKPEVSPSSLLLPWLQWEGACGIQNGASHKNGLRIPMGKPEILPKSALS
ncbi:MAG: hypothetical protein WHX93_15395 [bacterium]